MPRGVDVCDYTPLGVLVQGDGILRANVLLRSDVAADLRKHLGERLRAAQDAARKAGEPIPAQLPADEPLLAIPDSLVKRFDLDLLAAGLAKPIRNGNKRTLDKRDAQDRSLDLHCLRKSFNSLLAAAGVPLTTRQLLMRHALTTVTDAHYTDARLIDLRGALDNLPALPLNWPDAKSLPLAATGSGNGPSVYRPVYSPNDKPCTSVALAGKSAGTPLSAGTRVSASADESWKRLPSAGTTRRAGFEPATAGLEIRCSIRLSYRRCGLPWGGRTVVIVMADQAPVHAGRRLGCSYEGR